MNWSNKLTIHDLIQYLIIILWTEIIIAIISVPVISIILKIMNFRSEIYYISIYSGR